MRASCASDGSAGSIPMNAQENESTHKGSAGRGPGVDARLQMEE